MESASGIWKTAVRLCRSPFRTLLKAAAADRCGPLRKRRRQVMPAARIAATGIFCRPCQLLP